MIVCPNCNHQNPDGAVQCEACYTPLPEMTSCPNCGSAVQADASFCGQCGFNLKAVSPSSVDVAADASPVGDVPEFRPANPQIVPDPINVEIPASGVVVPDDVELPLVAPAIPDGLSVLEGEKPALPHPGEGRTQLQQQTARLLHVQTNTMIELPQNLAVIHLGKPNDRIPPDIDISGFPHSEIVSRIHADIRLEGDAFYIEDVGSSNGTYINNLPLPVGNRHRLRPGDRVALGKGDKVTFLFQLS